MIFSLKNDKSNIINCISQIIFFNVRKYLNDNLKTFNSTISDL